MGTTALLANSTIRQSPGWNAFYYWGIWAVCIICIGIVVWAALRSDKWARWTTQDILIVAALGVLLEVLRQHHRRPAHWAADQPDPGADFSQIQDLPYMFLLMVGVYLVRSPRTDKAPEPGASETLEPATTEDLSTQPTTTLSPPIPPPIRTPIRSAKTKQPMPPHRPPPTRPRRCGYHASPRALPVEDTEAAGAEVASLVTNPQPQPSGPNDRTTPNRLR